MSSIPFPPVVVNGNGSDHAAFESTPDYPACPPLPEWAQLDTEQETEAIQAAPWLDDWCHFAAQASPMTPPAFHTASGLFITSTMIARRACLKVSTTAIFPNLYLLFVGQSTRPRKTTGLNVAKGLLREAGLGFMLLADRQTPEALTMDLTARIPPTFTDWAATEQNAWLDERRVVAQRGWMLEEASHLLDSFDRDFTSGLLPLVLDLYDSAEAGPSRNTVNRGRESIQQPYICLFGATTYSAMAQHLKNQKLWGSGLFPRFALIGAESVNDWRFWPEPMPYPRSLVDRLREVAFHVLPALPSVDIHESEETPAEGGKPKKTRALRYTGELKAVDAQIDRVAWEQWELYSRAVTHEMLPDGAGDVPENLYASYGRLGAMLIKIALNLAVMDTQRGQAVRIEPRHVYRAQQIVESWRASLHMIVDRATQPTPSDASLVEDKILALLTKRGEWLAPREVAQAIRGLGTTEARGHLAGLAVAGVLVSQRVGKSEKYGFPGWAEV